GNEKRFDLYDLFFEKPEPLVTRPFRHGVTERIDTNGNVVVPLDRASVLSVAGLLRKQNVEAVSVCLLHSYRNARHERDVRDLLAEALPGIPVTLSSDVAPEMREYERTNTAAANAYVQPLIARYLDELRTKLEQRGFAGVIHLMLSGGGLTTL